MLIARRRFPALILVCLGFSGCAGYRGGWESVAYLGDTPPAFSSEAPTLHEARNRAALNVPGLQLRVAINNQLRTYDTQVYLFALPLSVDPRNVYPQNHEPGKTRVFVSVTPTDPGFVFRPSLAVLSIAGKRFTGIAGFDFDMWDLQGNRVKQGGKWDHRPVESDFALMEPGRRYLLSIDFATPVPSPESRDIGVDLSQALRATQHPPLPLIRFAPVRWKQGYT
ncbi:hypothetical protein [Polaromonas jejuensis]|uniref:Uncharacterized protein n=1 Tax=Polaromonas jejuensis TaxID=457502 RepID=A0ABW0Q387_9BURK|nr:hypothetical protein [Polaromonas jejuensis]